MSAVLTALYKDHATAEQVRTCLVRDGFPTDRVELTSRDELGQAGVEPAPGVAGKLQQYFQQLFHTEGEPDSVRQLEHAVLDGKAVIAVHPRGDQETKTALGIMEQAGPLEFKSKDLDKQQGEHAADAGSDALSWIGKVMVAPLAPHRAHPGPRR